MSVGEEERLSRDPLTVLMVMRLFQPMMPLYALPPRPAEGLPPLYKLLQGLVKAGHTVHFAGVVNPAVDIMPRRGDSREPFVVDGVYYYLLRLAFSKTVASWSFINPLRIGFTIYKYLRLLWHISTIIRRTRPRLLYVAGPYHFLGGLWGRLYGIPTVLRFFGVHNLRVLIRHRSSYFSNPWEMLAFHAPFDLAIIHNDGSRGDHVARYFGVPPEKVRFWNDGVDKEAYRPDFQREEFLARMGLAPNTKVLLSVNRLQDWKRIDRIVRALPSVVAHVPEAMLLLVGDGPERANLVNLSRSLGVEQHVRFAGAVPHTDVYAYLHAADIYISVQDFLNLGDSVLEAMVCGRCIVSLNDGSFDGLLTDDQELVLLDPDQVDEQLGPALVELLQDEPRRARLGDTAREFALSRLDSWEERIAREMAALESIARRESPEP